jgi:hypothetical protein
MSDQIPARARYLADLLADCEAAIELHRERTNPVILPAERDATNNYVLMAAMVQADAINGLRKAIEFKSRG